MLDGKFNLSPSYDVVGSLASALANLPLDRLIVEMRAITEAFDERNSSYQRLALTLGFRTWDVRAKNEEHDKIKVEAKIKRKEDGKIKAKNTRLKNKEDLQNLEGKLDSMKWEVYAEYYEWKKGKSISDKIKYLTKKTKIGRAHV